MKKKVAVLGGSFNPIHKGHLALGVAAHALTNAKVLVMPNSKTYYKQNAHAVTDQNRCEMVQAAIEPYSYMQLSTMEVDRGGETHTVDTVLELLKEYKEVYFILGGDSLGYLDKWVSADILFQKTIFLTAVRDEIDKEKSLELINRYQSLYGARIELLETPNYAISSSEIRRRISEGLDVSDMLPEAVEQYISAHSLYRI